MPAKDGRNATSAYRVRVAGTWYWVDPTPSAAEPEPGDVVMIYARGGESALAILRGTVGAEMIFTSLEGESFHVGRADIEALHLAAVDEDQSGAH